MTIRLLAAYGIYPCNAIVTLDSPTEAGLIAAKQALADTTGGTPYVAPVLPEAIDETKSGSAGTDSNGNVLTPALSSHNLVTGEISLLSSGPLGGSASPGGGATFVLTGDSQTRGNKSAIGTSAPTFVRSNGTVTANLGAAHTLVTGSPIYIENLTDADGTAVFDGWFTVTRTGANTITYLDDRPDATAVWGSTSVGTSGISHENWESGQSWWAYFNGFCGGGLRLLKNFGWGGAGETNIATRDAEAIALNPNYVIDLSGINDIGNQTAAWIAAAKIDRYIQYLNNGISVIAMSHWPLETGHAKFTAANNAAIIESNRIVAAWCAERKNAYFVDAYKMMVDPVSGTPGSCRANYLTDLIHQAPNGARQVGRLLYNQFKTLFSVTASTLTLGSDPKVSSNADNYGNSNTSLNLCDSAPWVATAGGATTGSTGSVTGTPPLGWTSACTGATAAVTHTVPARSDGFGYNAQCVFTAAAANDSLTMFYALPAMSRTALDDYLTGLIEIGLTNVSGSNLKGVNVGVIVYDGSGVNSASYTLSNAATSAARFGTEDFTMTYAVPPTIVHSLAGYCRLYVTLTFAAAGTALTVTMGRASVTKNAP